MKKLLVFFLFTVLSCKPSIYKTCSPRVLPFFNPLTPREGRWVEAWKIGCEGSLGRGDWSNLYADTTYSYYKPLPQKKEDIPTFSFNLPTNVFNKKNMTGWGEFYSIVDSTSLVIDVDIKSFALIKKNEKAHFCYCGEEVKTAHPVFKKFKQFLLQKARELPLYQNKQNDGKLHRVFVVFKIE